MRRPPGAAFWQGVEIEYAVATPPDVVSPAGPEHFLQALHRARLDGGAPPFVFLKGLGGFLACGGKAYVDHVSNMAELLELCTPECANALELLAYERALDEHVKLAHAEMTRRGEAPPHVYRAVLAYNRYGRATTRGLHESYLIHADRFERCVELLTPYLALRSLFCGTGGYVDGVFHISPRQLFVESVTSAVVPRDHPFVALQKESLTGAGFARLHLCNGEGARAEVTTLLRQAVTSWLVRCADLGILRDVPPLRDPLATARQLAGPPDGDWTITLADGRTTDAIDYLAMVYLPAIHKLFEGTSVALEQREALCMFEDVLDALRRRAFESLNRALDWCVKYELFELNPMGYFELDGQASSAEVRQGLDFQYRAVTDPFFEELEAELPLRRVTSAEALASAVASPPPGSRAAARVALARAAEIEEMDWDRVALRDGRVLSLPSLDGWDEPSALALLAGGALR